eukprot:GHVS01033316.1.p1 GENE.GHVS01033316.1~~GHVS01033316.1.p1  ORF type:complete len:113 (-),score=5.46 GHVS01033316.1:60-398(-)
MADGNNNFRVSVTVANRSIRSFSLTYTTQSGHRKIVSATPRRSCKNTTVFLFPESECSLIKGSSNVEFYLTIGEQVIFVPYIESGELINNWYIEKADVKVGGYVRLVLDLDV